MDESLSNERLVINSIPEDNQPLLEYLVTHQLVPDQLVTVKETAVTQGVITLDCNDRIVVFSYDVAAKIRVSPVD